MVDGMGLAALEQRHRNSKGGLHSTLIGVLPATPGGTNYQAYYDPTTNLTWLANANANGAMDWSEAMSWAASLNIGGVTGWTLPTTEPSCLDFNCTDSQMGYLYL